LIVGCPLVAPPATTGCTADADCGSGEVCTAGECVPDTSGGCTSDADCATGETCTNGECVPATTGGCTSDADCATGETCTNGECMANTNGGCTSDADCAAGETCTNGQCVSGTITGDAAAGETFFTSNGCGGCHGADANGGFGPSLHGVPADEIFQKLSGAVSHVGGTFDVTEQDAADVEAYIASL